MKHELRETLTKLICGKAESLMQHAGAFVDFWLPLEREDQLTALMDLMARYRHPEFGIDEPINGGTLPEGRLEELSGKVGGLIDATLSNIISKRMDLEEAAGEVQRLIMAREGRDEQVVCLAGIMSSNVIPYAVVPESNIRMSHEMYQEMLKEVSEGVSKIRIASGISRNAAEMADLVLSVLDQEMERERQVALLAYFIVLREQTVVAGRMSAEEVWGREG